MHTLARSHADAREEWRLVRVRAFLVSRYYRGGVARFLQELKTTTKKTFGARRLSICARRLIFVLFAVLCDVALAEKRGAGGSGGGARSRAFTRLIV